MRKPGPVLLLLSILLGESVGAQSASDPARFAIVIGQNISDKSAAPNLYYADDDAVATHRMFEEAGITSMLLVDLDEDSKRLNPELTPAGPPTRDNLLLVFRRLREMMTEVRATGRAVEFLFVYSGHGNVEHGEGYIVLAGSRLTRTDLYQEILARSPADRNHVIVDACKSYYLAFKKGPGGERQAYPRHFVEKDDASRFTNTGFLLSTSSGRDSHEWERYQAGVFSHEIRSALRGGADADGNRKITYEEIGAFLTTANERIANPRYRPDFLLLPPGEFSSDLIDWADHADVLILDDASWGHVYLENSRGERLLDVHPAAKEHFYIHVPSERPLFLRRANENGELVIATSGPAKISELSPRPTRIRRKGALHLAFEELFTVPFGQGNVRAYQQGFVPQTDAQSFAIAAKAHDSSSRIAKTTAIWTAIGATALGGAASIWAYSRYRSGENLSQARRAEINQDIERLNTAAVVLYSVAGAAAATWLTMILWPDGASRGGTLTVSPVLGPSVIGLGLHMQFDP